MHGTWVCGLRGYDMDALSNMGGSRTIYTVASRLVTPVPDVPTLRTCCLTPEGFRL